MFTYFKIKKFRCFEELEIKKLERINLFAGANNIGKTSLLEALMLYSGENGPGIVYAINQIRGFDNIKVGAPRDTPTPWESLFNNFDLSKEIILEGSHSELGHSTMKLKSSIKTDNLVINRSLSGDPGLSESTSGFKLSPVLSGHVSSGFSSSDLINDYQELAIETKYDNKDVKLSRLIINRENMRAQQGNETIPFRTVFLSGRMRQESLAENFSKIQNVNKQDDLIETLKLMAPKLLDVKVSYAIQEKPVLHADIGLGRLIPLAYLGGGINILAGIISVIYLSDGGLLLIDEIENGFHHSFLLKFWETIDKFSKEHNTQIIATTHSRECYEAAAEVFEEKDYFLFHRLEMIKGKIKCISIDTEDLSTAVDMNMEVR